MKIRIGFISNSSSTSFCILGIYIGDNKEEEGLILTKNNELHIKYGCMEGDDSIYVGLPPDTMKEDETLCQFRERVVNQLKEKDSKYKNVKLNWITDGGYNG